MRTDKKLPDNMPMGEWQEIVKEHYSEENQKSRIAYVVEFIYDHCLRSTKVQATFDGVWGYLDVDEKHLKQFKKRLANLRVNDHDVKVSYHTDNHEIIIDWSSDGTAQ